MMRREEGTVRGIMSVREGVQVVSVEMRFSGEEKRAVHYTDISPLLHPGDSVVLNVTAEELSLGSGGYHIVLPRHLDNGQLPSASRSTKGHIMKLKYTPLQRSVLAVEEEISIFHTVFNGDKNLEGMPVLLGELHSMLPAAVCWLRYRELQQNQPLKLSKNISYIMTDGGALPLAWSQHAAQLEDMRWLQSTITYGQAYGGKLEAINKFSALIAAKHVAKADLSLVTMGPGIVGTGTRYGYSGIEIGELVNAVHALGGTPIVIPRISFADKRSRHRGISHHTLTALQLAARCPAVVPLPQLEDDEHAMIGEQAYSLERHRVMMMPVVSIEEIAEAFSSYPQPITSMGRGLWQDPAYFQGVCAAVDCAIQLDNQSM
ncbi:DUF3866 family protein [Paenibacillus aceris]|uniref:DUF3866 family protein n=1 Tax=Paenibacillus aceris TaxID=869555 RepID=A0ABS4HTU5_9BACL|nr:DUF3866 family protein [Paenibacillus aceris]MBP1962050.1 hypothetical protein [Paenibacillus aceris]NHW34102.1 DUF3866 family protein [Paenibacillus aceris]